MYSSHHRRVTETAHKPRPGAVSRAAERDAAERNRGRGTPAEHLRRQDNGKSQRPLCSDQKQ